MTKFLLRFSLILFLLGLVGCGETPTATPVPVAHVGELPLPAQVTHLDFSLDDLKKINDLGSNAALNNVTIGAYSSSQPPAGLLKFYQTELKKAGWTADESRSQAGLLYFNKDNQTASVIATAVPNAQAADTLSNVIPVLKGKLKAGDSLLILAVGPQSAFAMSNFII